MSAFRLVILTFALLIGVAASAQDLVTPSDRVVTHVNIRAGASGDAERIGQLDIGEALPLVASVPHWYQVRLPDGRTGFVSKAWTTTFVGLAPRREDELRVHFLNIGAGTCTVVECPGPNAAPMIVDCGSSGRSPEDMTPDETRDYIRDILEAHEAAPRVVLSHGHADHYDLIAEVLDDVAVASIWRGGRSAEYTSGAFPEWLSAQVETHEPELRHDLPAHFHNDGEPVDGLACGEASTYVLTANTPSSENARSLVLMIRHGEFSVVFTGDAEGVTERQAIANFPDALKTTVMTSSHHGARTHGSNSAEWAAATSPEVLISSAGSRYRHPTCTAVQRFTSLTTTTEHEVRCGAPSGYVTSRTDRAHYVTAVSGTIIVTSNGRSPLMLNCTRSNECGVRIDF